MYINTGNSKIITIPNNCLMGNMADKPLFICEYISTIEKSTKPDKVEDKLFLAQKWRIRIINSLESSFINGYEMDWWVWIQCT